MQSYRPPKGAIIDTNDRHHDFTDPNKGGGPRSRPPGVSQQQRGGVGSKPPVHKMPHGRTKPTASNPASRGGTPGAFRPDRRIPGHGGSPQKSGHVPPKQRGGFSHSGQKGVPTYPHANPPLKAGNTRGRTYKLIAGRFQRDSMRSGGQFGGGPVGEDA